MRAPLRPSPRGVWRFLKARLHDVRETAGDRRLGIDTYSRPVVDAPGLDVARVHYEALFYPCIRLIATKLDLGPQDVLCDAGCGKGRVLCFFSREPIKACVGLEYQPDLAADAERNLSQVRGRRAPATVIVGDAADYDYSQVTALVMYNPFGADTLRAVLAKLVRSLEGNPRRIQIAYANPAHADVVGEFPAFVERDRFHPAYVRGRMGVIIFSNAR